MKKTFFIAIIAIIITGCVSKKETGPIIPPRPTVQTTEDVTSNTTTNTIPEEINVTPETNPSSSSTNTTSSVIQPESKKPKTDITAPATPAVREFNLTAKRFEFTPSTITVNKGDKVKINITSQDVNHGFTISEYNIHETIEPGKQTTVEFIADKAGTFSFYCSVFCGAGHGGMKGSLIVK